MMWWPKRHRNRNFIEGEVVYTFVNGEMVAFEGVVIRKGYGAGGWVTRSGTIPRRGVGDLTRIRGNHEGLRERDFWGRLKQDRDFIPKEH